MGLACTPNLSPTGTAHITAKPFLPTEETPYMSYSHLAQTDALCAHLDLVVQQKAGFGRQQRKRNLNRLKRCLGQPPNFGTKPTGFPGNN